MLTTALMAFFAAFFCYFVQWTFGQPMIDQPLGVGLVAGIIFGDVTTGIIIGAALQAIFMGSVNVGGATSADTVCGTVLAVCFVETQGMDQASAITLATAAAVFANFIYSFIFNVAMSFWAPIIDWAASKGDKKSIFICHFGGALVMNLAMAVPTFFAVYIGAEPASELMDMVPDAVMNGFNAASGLLPAVGMALMLQMLWDSKTAVFYFLGFVLFSYLDMPMIAVAVVGVVIIVVTGLRDMEVRDVKNRVEKLYETGTSGVGMTKAELEEEDFFA